MKKTNLWKRFVLIDALIVLSIVSVYAWFIMGDTARVDSMEENVIEAGYIKISEDGGKTWENGLDIDLGEAGIIREMSGDGLDLYEPVYGIDDIEGYELTRSDEYYIQKTFTFETDMTHEIYLKNGSFLLPSDTEGNLSNMGNYSRDYIAGAVRVAFFEVQEDGTNNPIYIWAPNPEIQFTGDTVIEKGTVEEYYYYQIGEGVGDIVQISTDNNQNGVSDDEAFVWGMPEQDGVKPLLSFSTENNVPVRKTLMMRVWLEGTDRECVKELHNGKFKMYFDFNTSSTQTESGKEQP